MSLSGKRVLVTGAGTRLGSVLARAAAARGAAVALHANQHFSAAVELAGELRAAGGIAEAFRADFAEPEAALLLATEVAREFGPLDGLVLSAAIWPRGPLETLRQDELERTLRINLSAPLLLARQVGLEMRTGQGGAIVALLDWSLDRPYVDGIAYAVSKAGLRAGVIGLARMLAPSVRVNGLALGAVLLQHETPPEQARGIARANLLGRIGTPEEVAEATIFLLSAATFTTGSILEIDGGRARN